MAGKRYIVDERGNRIAVILEVADYEQLLAAVRELEALRSEGAGRDSDAPYTEEEKAAVENRLKALGYL